MPKDTSILLAGDALITRPWSHVEDPLFWQLVEAIRSSDASIANLETVVHEFNGYPQRDSGGTYMVSPPEIAAELKWAGFDMLSHANNHAYDYGSTGILETLQHTSSAGLLLAGSGADLEEARAAKILRRAEMNIALVSMTTNFAPYGQASRTRGNVAGRPGVNPLTLTKKRRAIVVPAKAAANIRAIGKALGVKASRLNGRAFKVGLRFHQGRKLGTEKGYEIYDSDRIANLEAIRKASQQARIVVVSIHAHIQGRWLREFAMDAIEQGASIVFVHGPHEVAGIELYSGRPIFYSLGDFAYEVEHIDCFPAEAYEKYGLGEDATHRDLTAAARKSGLSFIDKREAFEGVVSIVRVNEGNICEIDLLPIDLQFDAGEQDRGRPRIAPPETGRRIIERLKRLSLPNGTHIEYDPLSNRGRIRIA